MPAVAIDLTRLWTRLGQPSPSGIDRVELAYARHVLGGEGARFGLVSTELGPRVLDRATALDLAETVAAGWVEDAPAEADPVYCRLAGLPPPRRAEARPGREDVRRLRTRTGLRVLRGGGPGDLPSGTAYLHVSHLRLERPRRFDWLYGRPDIRAVFTVHDLIPIQYPEYCRPGEAARHAARLETVAAHAAHVLVDTAAIGAELRDHLVDRGRAAPPVTAAHLGIEPAFLDAARAGQPFDRPTFIVCGTIEPRKNHLVLLNLWRNLARRGGPMPRLLVVGRRGWEAESAVAMLDRCPALHGHVVEVADLSTPALAQVMRRATALLMPSYAEGYGLPVLEAAACGLPVVASDIPVHRETAGPFAHFVDPDDGAGWMRAVEALTEPASALRADLARRLAAFTPPTWEAYFERVEAVIAGL
jgi:glycosyltransferase involved in cell wall biosynthesis